MSEGIESEVSAFSNEQPVHDWLRQIIAAHVDAVLNDPQLCMPPADNA
jgi:hypothetical protein